MFAIQAVFNRNKITRGSLIPHLNLEAVNDPIFGNHQPILKWIKTKMTVFFFLIQAKC